MDFNAQIAGAETIVPTILVLYLYLIANLLLKTCVLLRLHGRDNVLGNKASLPRGSCPLND
jgi:hypothetical protein